MSPASELLRTIQQYGMVGCNVCPYLRSIDEVGGSWQAAMELIDQKQIFYSKVFRHRTVYLSRELYGLLKCIRGEKEVSYNYNLQRLLTILQGGKPMSTQELKAESCFTGDTYSKAFQKVVGKFGCDRLCAIQKRSIRPGHPCCIPQASAGKPRLALRISPAGCRPPKIASAHCCGTRLRLLIRSD